MSDIVGTWDIGTVTYGDVAAGFETPVEFTVAEDGTVTGSTGCAGYGAFLNPPVSGTNVIYDFVTEDSACADESQQSLANDIAAVLEGGFLVHIVDGQLLLISSTAETTLVGAPAA
jgi:hypothetical protein